MENSYRENPEVLENLFLNIELLLIIFTRWAKSTLSSIS